nr:glycosyltransferase [Rhabdothermincola salaria]
MVEAMEGLGHRVVKCNEPLRVSTAERVRLVRRPWLAGPVLLQLLKVWWRLARRARRIGRETPDVVLVGYLGVLDVHLARCCFAAPVILDNMAPLGGIAEDRDLPLGGLLRVIDRVASAASSVVVWDTEAHRILGSTTAKATEKALVVHVGAPDEWFHSDGGAPDPTGPLEVCFFGLYTPLQGTTVIAEAIRRVDARAAVTWTLIGDGQQRALVEETVGPNPSVRWVDWLEPEALARTVAAHDVCLGIFGTTPKAMRVVPNKVYQGAAAGCAVVTSGTESQRAVLGGAGIYVPAGDAEALADAIVALASDPEYLEERRSAARSRALEAFSPEALRDQIGEALRAASLRGRHRYWGH